MSLLSTSMAMSASERWYPSSSTCSISARLRSVLALVTQQFDWTCGLEIERAVDLFYEYGAELLAPIDELSVFVGHSCLVIAHLSPLFVSSPLIAWHMPTIAVLAAMRVMSFLSSPCPAR